MSSIRGSRNTSAAVQFSVIHTKSCVTVLLFHRHKRAGPWTLKWLNNTLVEHLLNQVVHSLAEGKGCMLHRLSNQRVVSSVNGMCDDVGRAQLTFVERKQVVVFEKKRSPLLFLFLRQSLRLRLKIFQQLLRSFNWVGVTCFGIARVETSLSGSFRGSSSSVAMAMVTGESCPSTRPFFSLAGS